MLGLTAVPISLAVASPHLPTIIQGGMGAGVSDWRLARAVSSRGQLGVVSGTALDVILVRRLQMGDPGGHVRRGLAHFPVPAIAERIWQRYYVPGGKGAERPFKPLPLHDIDAPRELAELCIAGNFVEVFLAREGHDHPVGINYLEKIQLPHLPSIYGAMLAGVGYVLMGAFCDESGLRADYKDALLAQVRAGTARVHTDPLASPTSFPFKVAQLAGTISEPSIYHARTRVCDLGYLREAYRTEDGSIGFRCAAEPVNIYVGKGGPLEDTVGRKCICNALLANIGLGQLRGREPEPGVVTSGDDLAGLTRFIAPGTTRYTAADVIARLLERR